MDRSKFHTVLKKRGTHHERPLREPGIPVQRKRVYRIKAKDAKRNLVFLKTRTKEKVRTIKRFLTLKGLTPDRVTE